MNPKESVETAAPKTETAVQTEKPVSPEAEEAAPQGNAPLTQEEQQLLEQSEKTIKAGLGQFVEVGKALSEIDVHQLYRLEFDTFKDYCRQRWGMSDKYAYRLINAAKCVTVLKEKLTAQNVSTFPANEYQVRPLLGLDPEKWPDAWQNVLKNTAGEQITSDCIEGVVDELAGKPKSKKHGTPKVKLEKAEKKLQEIAVLVSKGLEKSNLSKEKLMKLFKQIHDLLG